MDITTLENAIEESTYIIHKGETHTMKTKETQKTPYDNLDEKEVRTFLKVLDSLPSLKIGIPDVRWWIEQLNKKS